MIAGTRFIGLLMNDDGSIYREADLEAPWELVCAQTPETSRRQHPSNVERAPAPAPTWELILMSEPRLDARRRPVVCCLYRPVAATTEGVAGDHSEW